MKADFISLRPLPAVRETDWSQGERDRVREEEEEEEGARRKKGGGVRACVCVHVSAYVCACVYTCVCTCMHVGWSEKQELRLQAERSPKKVLDRVPW